VKDPQKGTTFFFFATVHGYRKQDLRANSSLERKDFTSDAHAASRVRGIQAYWLCRCVTDPSRRHGPIPVETAPAGNFTPRASILGVEICRGRPVSLSIIEEHMRFIYPTEEPVMP
jgi:hypothetical protein